MKISIHDVARHGTIAAAIEAISSESEYIASGIIGSCLSTSGPGIGWSKHYDVHDYARRALADNYGAASYIDSEDGREATLDDDGDLVWTNESVIELVTPTLDEALEWPAAYAEIAKGAKGTHSYNVYEQEWEKLAEEISQGKESA